MNEPLSHAIPSVEVTEASDGIAFPTKAELHFGRKLVAWYMLVDAALQFGVSLFLAAGRGHLIGALIEALLGIYILRGSRRAIIWAQLLTVLSAIVLAGMSFSNGEIALGILIVAGQSAILRLLASKPGRSVAITCAVILFLALAGGVLELFIP